MPSGRPPSATHRPAGRWGVLLAAVLPAGVMLQVESAQANGSSQALFLDSLAELRGHDPAVRDVAGIVLQGSGGNTGCGAAPEGDLVVFYCPRDRTIYAAASSLEQVAQRFGTAGVHYLAAHEMAHGRQHAITGYARNIVRTSVLDELQADCIAGAYLNRLYGYTVSSQAGELARQFAYSIGDHSYLHPDWHGNPRLRVAALSRGMNQGEPVRCLSSSRFNYGTLLEQGATWLQRWQQMQRK
ncbi:MAG: neutral zinc metallopeptidase [Synechococcaceae cyanobacterium]|nr:neutral zinc metallopeptidase [Synechococcaceae cyanobacterium]